MVPIFIAIQSLVNLSFLLGLLRRRANFVCCCCCCFFFGGGGVVGGDGWGGVGGRDGDWWSVYVTFSKRLGKAYTKYCSLASRPSGGIVRVCFFLPQWRCYRGFGPLVSHTKVHAGCGRPWRTFLERFWLWVSSLCTYTEAKYTGYASLALFKTSPCSFPWGQTCGQKQLLQQQRFCLLCCPWCISIDLPCDIRREYHSNIHYLNIAWVPDLSHRAPPFLNPGYNGRTRFRTERNYRFKRVWKTIDHLDAMSNVVPWLDVETFRPDYEYETLKPRNWNHY